MSISISTLVSKAAHLSAAVLSTSIYFIHAVRSESELPAHVPIICVTIRPGALGETLLSRARTRKSANIHNYLAHLAVDNWTSLIKTQQAQTLLISNNKLVGCWGFPIGHAVSILLCVYYSVVKCCSLWFTVTAKGGGCKC